MESFVAFYRNLQLFVKIKMSDLVTMSVGVSYDEVD